MNVMVMPLARRQSPEAALEAAATAHCDTCARLRRRVDGLGRLRFDLQKQINQIEARARLAEARVAELERALRA